MKTTIKYFIGRSALTILLMSSALVWTAGCAGFIHHSDPLAGWKYMYLGQLDKAIVDDYKAFVQTLPVEERMQLDEPYIHPYEDGKGGRAVRFEIGKSGMFYGTLWDYVLIYNKENKRIKVIKYTAGKYGEM